MEDYKIRFINEYNELKIKTGKLENLLKGYKAGTLNFTPTCSYELLNTQLMIMKSYLAILEERARLEFVELGEKVD